MANQYETSFNYHKKRFGEIFGQPFTVYNVDYTAQDQTPTLVSTKKKYKVEVGSKSLVQNALPNGSYYCCHGDYYGVNPGYVLVPQRSDSSTPIVTVISKSPFEEITCLRTSRICSIYNGEELLYSNCYFDFPSTTNYPDRPLHRLLSSPEVPEMTIIMYRRDLRTSDYDTEGLLLRETDSDPNIDWKITQITELGNQMILTLKMSVVE